MNASACAAGARRVAAGLAAVGLALLAAACTSAGPVLAQVLARTSGGPLGAAGATPFAVTLDHAFGGRPATVVDMRTGQRTGQVPVPVKRSDFEWVAAEPGDHAFVLADQSQALVYRFYLLRLGRHGQPSGLTRLPVPALDKIQIYGLAVAPDGSKLAIAWIEDYGLAQRGRIEVASLATGSARTWSGPGAATTLSWQNNAVLAVGWQGLRAHTSGIRLLNVTARGTNLLASRLLVPAVTTFRGLTSPSLQFVTTRGVFADMAGGQRRTLVAIVEFSATTGRPMRIVRPAVNPAPSASGALLCGVAWADRSGEHLITQCGSHQYRIDGTNATPIVITAIPADDVGFANAFAW